MAQKICRDQPGIPRHHLYLDLNKENGPIISKKASPATVRVMKTHKELMIARHNRDLLTG